MPMREYARLTRTVQNEKRKFLAHLNVVEVRNGETRIGMRGSQRKKPYKVSYFSCKILKLAFVIAETQKGY